MYDSEEFLVIICNNARRQQLSATQKLNVIRLNRSLFLPVKASHSDVNLMNTTLTPMNYRCHTS